MKREDELTIIEWEKVLASLGSTPYWFTISGGEPLLHPDLDLIIARIRHHVSANDITDGDHWIQT